MWARVWRGGVRETLQGDDSPHVHSASGQFNRAGAAAHRPKWILRFLLVAASLQCRPLSGLSASAAHSEAPVRRRRSPKGSLRFSPWLCCIAMTAPHLQSASAAHRGSDEARADLCVHRRGLAQALARATVPMSWRPMPNRQVIPPRLSTR